MSIEQRLKAVEKEVLGAKAGESVVIHIYDPKKGAPTLESVTNKNTKVIVFLPDNGRNKCKD